MTGTSFADTVDLGDEVAFEAEEEGSGGVDQSKNITARVAVAAVVATFLVVGAMMWRRNLRDDSGTAPSHRQLVNSQRHC